MAYYVAGDTIQEPFVSESLATGLTFTRIASLALRRARSVQV